MNKELKNDLITTLNEVVEAKENIEGGDLWEAVSRCENAIYWLEKYVSTKDTLCDLNEKRA